MNDPDLKVKQQIVEKIKGSTNILITVSKDPSVDDLSAAIGFAALLNKLDKHATVVFSGVIPPALSFLEPDKVFENNGDSLRDFIIALDKEKADHLRYKVEGDVVRIFITPYRTRINEHDLEFSQGDYNIEMVITLGVDTKEPLDEAITAEKNIFDNTTVATFTNGPETSQLGSLNWHDDKASSLSEMIVSLSDSLKTDKTLLDQQIATALLTGIVAATDRFSNDKTSSRIMTTAAQLMAAGANQQLIASKLADSHEINELTINPNNPDTKDEEVVVDHSFEEPMASTLPSQEEPQIEISTVNSLPEMPVFEDITSTLPEDPAPEIINDHSYVGQSPIETSNESVNENNAPEDNSMVDIFASDNSEQNSSTLESEQSPVLGDFSQSTPDLNEQQISSTLPEVENPTMESTLSNTENVEMDNSTVASDFSEPELESTLPPPNQEPVIEPADFGLPLPPPIPDFSNMPGMPMTDQLASTLPPVENAYFKPLPTTEESQPATSVEDNPSQFRIPGQ